MIHTSAYLLGLDLGQKNDYTALTVLRQKAVPTGGMQTIRYQESWGETYTEHVPVTEYHYDVIHAERWRGRSYNEVVGKVDRLYPVLTQRAFDEARSDPSWLSGPMPHPNVLVSLIVDATGVGAPVVDSLRGAGLNCTAVTIHGGDAVMGKGDDLRVPKRDLVGTLQVLFQGGRLAIASQLELSGVMRAELENFRAKIKLNGHDSYGAGEDWREGNHDDLVLSMAMAAWYGEYKDPVGQDASWRAILAYVASQ